MKSGSLRFEFEVKVKRNILVLFYHTELIIVSVLKTSKNLEGTCHLLMLLCWVFGGKCLSASVRTCLSASEFSVYFYYYFIWYHTLLVLTFWDNTPVSFWILCLCTFTLFYSKYWYVCMYRTHWSLSNLHILPVVSAYLTPSSQLPSFPTNRYRIQQQYLPTKMHLSFPFKRRELFNWRICFPVKYFTTELACHTICCCKYWLTVINGVVVSDNLGISEHCVPLHL